MTSWRFGRRPARRSLWMFTTSLLPINWRELAAIWFNCVSACQNFNAIFSDQNFRGTGWFDAYLLLQTPRASRLLLRLLHPAGRPPIACCRRCCRCSLGKPGAPRDPADCQDARDGSGAGGYSSIQCYCHFVFIIIFFLCSVFCDIAEH